MTKITRVTLTEFEFEAANLAPSAEGSSIGGLHYRPGASTPIKKYAVEVETGDGCIGS